MKCIYCGTNTPWREHGTGVRQSSKSCRSCHRAFAFEPRAGDEITDLGFSNAIDAVGEKGSVRWTADHLYYEVCRRVRRGRLLHRMSRRKTVSLSRYKFDAMLGRWVSVHSRLPGLLGSAPGLPWGSAPHEARLEGQDRFALERPPPSRLRPQGDVPREPGRRPAADAPTSPMNADLADYSFDRAVVSDRDQTAALLIANNFHVAHRCAVISVNGYPEGTFQTVLPMLQRSERLTVVAVHDATPSGCVVPRTLAREEEWFARGAGEERTRVIDLGLRPKHARQFRGVLSRPVRGEIPVLGISTAEAKWLADHSLELAAVRPRTLMRVISRRFEQPEDDNRDVILWGDQGGESSDADFG